MKPQLNFRTLLKLCCDSKLAVRRWRRASYQCVIVCCQLCVPHAGDCAPLPLMHLIVHYLSARAPAIVRRALRWLAACYMRLALPFAAVAMAVNSTNSCGLQRLIPRDLSTTTSTAVQRSVEHALHNSISECGSAHTFGNAGEPQV